ncbi:hypothetical protein [Novipirellula rosea]|uniref:Uncharacterized protein n=1 Tax=Novipirellula rosea TaxID=1031540 RepID=A0ABP8NTQ4_9BACT
MTNKSDEIADRIGGAINELDIDFSNFTLLGWMVSLMSLGIGGGAAYAACYLMVQRNGWDKAAGLVFCFSMIAVTTCSFLMLRWMLRHVGMSITKQELSEQDGIDERDLG